jgi:hypothetical protein
VTVAEKPTGPFSLRDLDVKFRTNELNSTSFVWREGMSAWVKVFEEPTLRSLLQDSKSEVALPEAVSQAIDQSADESGLEDNELCYFNKEENCYKLFKDGKWESQAEKPTAEEIQDLKPKISEEELAKKELR